MSYDGDPVFPHNEDDATLPTASRHTPSAPGAAHAHRACIAIEATADEVRVCADWYGPIKPRCPAPPLTPAMLAMADTLARAALQAEPGELARYQGGSTYVYRRRPSSDVVVV